MRVLNVFVRVLSSFKLSVALLVLLGLLTWLGTLAQVDKGLYQVQKEYFESWFVVQQVGFLRVPLPGATLVMAVLFLNLIVGGVVRLRRRWTNAGILVTHLGIALLLVAGFVKMDYSISGRLALFPGQRDAVFESFHDWELALTRKMPAGLRERVVPESAFRNVTGSKPLEVTAPDLPFHVELSHYMPNCDVMPKGPNFNVAVPVVEDGVFLARLKPAGEFAANVAGAYATVVLKDSGQRETGILWGRDFAPFDRNRYPWTFQAGGETWGLELRRAQFPLPFAIRLDKFIKEDHPGTTMPRVFTSEITVTEEEADVGAIVTMNAPLRKEGYVAYQASFGPPSGPPYYSQFEIAQNPSDQWPLAACIVIALGLLMHFGRKLYRYIWSENLKRTMKTAQAATLLLFTLCLLTTAAPAQHEHEGGQAITSVRRWAWSPEVLETMGKLPVQQGGRVMPLSTVAAFSLYGLHGRRDLKLEEVKLTPTEWLLDAMFFPGTADNYPLFRIENRDGLTAIGAGQLAGKGLNFDYVSFNELAPSFDKLDELWRLWRRKDDKDRSPLEQQVVTLGNNLISYMYVRDHLKLLRTGFPVQGAEEEKLLGGTRVSFVTLVRNRAGLEELAAKGGGNASFLLERLRTLAANERESVKTHGARPAPAMFPPTDRREAWPHLEELGDPMPGPRHMEMLVALERMVQAGHDATIFGSSAGVFSGHAAELARSRGEYDKVEQEVLYYERNWHYQALHYFLASLIAVGAVWLLPRKRWLHWLAVVSVAFPLGLLVADITMRSILRDRPPITNLYDTFLFITAVIVGVALVVEVINRRRVALSLAPFIGALGITLARKFEVEKGEDTLHELQAVLDSNFWLATHVTTINIGYAAGMLAAALGAVYLMGRMASFWGKGEAGYLKSVARMVYGVTCFGLLFAVVGTILGGIWANDSWGRFWGWDPKENGALLICLAQIAILHARMGGFLKDFGLAMAAVFTGTIVAFSWFHVNILGVGLHSYGFSSGLARGLWITYYVHWGIMGVGVVLWLMERSRAQAPQVSRGDRILDDDIPEVPGKAKGAPA